MPRLNMEDLVIHDDDEYELEQEAKEAWGAHLKHLKVLGVKLKKIFPDPDVAEDFFKAGYRKRALEVAAENYEHYEEEEEEPSDGVVTLQGMPALQCDICNGATAILDQCGCGAAVCRDCFDLQKKQCQACMVGER